MTNSNHAQAFLMHRNVLLDLLAKIPADKADFRAWDGGMTIKELTEHLAKSTEMIRRMIMGEAPMSGTPSMSFTEAQEYLRTSAAQACTTLEGLRTEMMQRTVPAFGGRPMSIQSLVTLLHDHEIHHKGQLWMMARMVGVEPPMFVKLG